MNQSKLKFKKKLKLRRNEIEEIIKNALVI